MDQIGILPTDLFLHGILTSNINRGKIIAIIILIVKANSHVSIQIATLLLYIKFY
jgi:hypothetical protein